jgi:hypothetical protein
MPRDVSELERSLSRLKKEGRLLTKKQIEEINEMVYILPSKTKKEYKEEEIMKGKSDLKKVGDKYAVETELNIKKGLEPKVKRALKKSVDKELNKKISGSGVRKIKLDMSSDEEETPKKTRGRPKKGKGYPFDDDSSSDEEDLKEYSKILKHLLSHILDKNERTDPKDVKQAKELIDKIKSKKQ